MIAAILRAQFLSLRLRAGGRGAGTAFAALTGLLYYGFWAFFAFGMLMLFSVPAAEETILAPVLPTQAAVVEFHTSGAFKENLENLKQLYAPRLQAIVTALKTELPGLPFAEPEGGFFVSITLTEGTNTTNLLARAREEGLTLTDGRDFFADPLDDSADKDQGSRFVRLPFCALTPAQIQEGVKRLATLVTR